MLAPGDKRPTWGDGIIQIHITRACDLACNGCTQGSNLTGKPVMMTIEQFDDAVSTLRDYYGIVGIFGGNPCVHPKFPEICERLEEWIPFERRGLWSNNLRGYGNLCRNIFNPLVSNLNVHGKVDAYLEMVRDWPECQPKGLTDSRHSPPFVSPRDLGYSDNQIKLMIENCDINRYWSAMIGVFRGELRAWFCELAGAQSMLHENEIDYPDTGLAVTHDWWQKPMENFQHQVNKHCYECGIPLKIRGPLAMLSNYDMVSKTHINIVKRKQNGIIQLINDTSNLEYINRVTDYIENGSL